MAPKLGIAAETLRWWVEQAEVDAGDRPGVTSSAAEEIRRLKRENQELRRANEIMADRFGVFRRGARPVLAEMIAYIDMYRDQFGVESICATLAQTEGGFITSRGYRAAKQRPASMRGLRHEVLIPEIQRVHGENYSVYGSQEDLARVAPRRLEDRP